MERNLPGLEPDEDPIAERLVEMLGDSQAKTLALDHVPVARSDAARDALARFRVVVAAEGRAEAELQRAKQNREETQARLDRLRAEREGLGRIFRRHERALLDTNIAGHERALDFWHTEATRGEEEHAQAIERRDGWLLEYGADAVGLLLAEDSSLDEVRNEVVARLHSDSIGLSDRDEWSRAVVENAVAPNLDGPELELAPPPVDIGFDLGP